MRRAFPRPIFVALCAALGTPFIPGPSTVRAQVRPAPPMTGAVLERFVPDSAGFCFFTPSLGESERGLRSAHAWRLWSVLLGGAVEDTDPPDLAAAIGRILGAQLSIEPADLASREMVFAARSWSDFAGSVVLIRAPEDDLIDRWFPASRRMRGDAGQVVSSFRTVDGLIVMRRGDIVAMGRYVGRKSLVVPVMGLLRGTTKDALAGSSEFQRLRSHLPPRALAQVYIGVPREAPDGSQSSSALLPRVDQAVVGVYENDSRMELAVRGSVAGPVFAQGRLPIDAVERLLSLPRTTLMAAATTLDFPELVHVVAASDRADLSHRAWNLFTSLRRLGAQPEPDLPPLGPSAIAVWDQDLSGRGTTPQAAVLLQCADAQVMTKEVTRIADNVLRVLATIDPGLSSNSLRIDESRHLGVRVRSVPLGRVLSGSRVAVAELLSGLEPAWAASGDWLIIALGREHLERILDARFGLAPTLGLMDDARALRQNPNRQTGVLLVQGELAADVMDRWLADATAGSDSLLAPVWWDRIIATEVDRRLGVTMQQDEETGFVRVQATIPGTPPAGVLKRGDRIVAINGTVLDLSNPVEDLRDRWLRAPPGRRLTLRVLRGDQGVDVSVPTPNAGESAFATQLQPLDAMRELASLVRAIPFATFVVYATDERHYSARIALRLFTPKGAKRR